MTLRLPPFLNSWKKVSEMKSAVERNLCLFKVDCEIKNAIVFVTDLLFLLLKLMETNCQMSMGGIHVGSNL